MKLFDRIEAIISKSINAMTIDDQYELIKCYDELLQERAKRNDQVGIKKQEIDDYEADRTLVLKNETDEKDGKVKNKYTEKEIGAIIQQETRKMITELAEAKFVLEKIDGKQKAVFSFITCIRDFLRPALVLTQD